MKKMGRVGIEPTTYGIRGRFVDGHARPNPLRTRNVAAAFSRSKAANSAKSRSKSVTNPQSASRTVFPRLLGAVGMICGAGLGGCERITGVRPASAPCKPSLFSTDTLVVFLGRSGAADSVRTRTSVYVHFCGTPYLPPAKPKPDTVRTSVAGVDLLTSAH